MPHIPPADRMKELFVFFLGQGLNLEGQTEKIDEAFGIMMAVEMTVMIISPLL